MPSLAAAQADTASGAVAGGRRAGLARMASTEKDESRRPGARGVPGPALRCWGAGEPPERGGWSGASGGVGGRRPRGTGLDMARLPPGRALGEEPGPVGGRTGSARGEGEAPRNVGERLVGQERAQRVGEGF